MKTVKLVTIALALSINITSHIASAENIGNGNGDLVLKSIMQPTPGLTPEEKIYQLWIEAEGSLPRIDSSSDWYGLGVHNSGYTDSPVNTYGQEIVSFKLRNAYLSITRTAELAAGPIIILPEESYISEYAYADRPFLNRPDIDTFDLMKSASRFDGQPTPIGNKLFIKRAESLSTGIRSVITHNDLRHDKEVEYRQVTPDIIVSVSKMNKPTDEFTKPCLGSKRYTRTEIQKVTETVKTKFGKTKTVTVEKPVEIVEWKHDPSFKVPGVCSVSIFYNKIK